MSGQRVLVELHHDLVRHRPDVGARQRALDDVNGVADRRREDLRPEAVVVVDRADLPDQVHPVDGNVVQPSDEGRDERSRRTSPRGGLATAKSRA